MIVHGIINPARSRIERRLQAALLHRAHAYSREKIVGGGLNRESSTMAGLAEEQLGSAWYRRRHVAQGDVRQMLDKAATECTLGAYSISKSTMPGLKSTLVSVPLADNEGTED